MIEIAVTVVVISAVVEAIKRAWSSLPGRWIPLLSIVVGIILTVVYGFATGDMNFWIDVVTGLGTGLAASGLYSNVKSVATK